MKKENKFVEFLNSKGFYTALFTCLFAVLAIAAFVSIKNIDAISKLTTYGESDGAALDEQLQSAVVQMESPVSELSAEKKKNDAQNDAQQPKDTNKTDTTEVKTEKSVQRIKTEEKAPAGDSQKSEEQARTQGGDAAKPGIKEETPADTKPKETTEADKAKPESTEKTESKEQADAKANEKTDVKTQDAPESKPKTEDTSRSTAAAPSFNDGDEMGWPLDGAIVMDFSQSHAIYDKTLDQYRTNPTISISSEVGTQVKAAADGIVKSISIDPRTGYTVVLEHGNGWETRYGQLQETVLVAEGQSVTKGQAIGGVGTPTKYGVLLGSHLVFGINKDDVPQNPTLVLLEAGE